MSLPAVEWKYVGKQYIGTGTIYPNTILDSIYTLSSQTVYNDGTSRLAGSGSAGTWGRYQNAGVTEAIYVTPPSGSQSIIIAGASGTPSPSPTMNTLIGGVSGYYPNKLYVNMTKNPGSFNSWNNVSPFTSGSSFGYVPFLGARGAASGIISYGSVVYSYLFESKESVAVFIIETNTTDATSYSNGFIAGAVVDPQSSNSNDAESDGRVYGIFSTGHALSATVNQADWANTNNLWTVNWHSDAEINSFLYGYNTSSTVCGGRAGVFLPGTSTVIPVAASHKLNNVTGTVTGTVLLTSSGRYITVPILIKSINNPFVVGNLRNISYCIRGIIGQRFVSGSNTIGHIVSCSNRPTTSAEAILLEY